MQHFYTHAIDMTNSEAFYQGFYDDVEKVLYLTFRTGTSTSRIVPSTTTPEDVDEIESWGRQWWASIKDMPTGPTVDPGDEFVYRAAPVQAEEPAAEEPAVEREPVNEDASIAWSTFKDTLVEATSEWGEEWYVEDYEDELRAALDAALATVAGEPTETANDEPAEGLAEATRNSEGTFVGIGFVDVPEDKEHALLSLLNGFNQFAREQVPGVQSFVERYNVTAMRNFMRGLL